jgi:Family of unknown function (DUF6325)
MPSGGAPWDDACLGSTSGKEFLSGVHGPEVQEELDPIDFFAIEFPDGRPSAAGFQMLLDLVERGMIQILDLEFITKGRGGNVKTIPVSEVSGEADLTIWDGASSGLLDEADIAQVGSALPDGGIALAVVYENRWVIGLVDVWRRDGARLIDDGGLPVDEVVAAHAATEPE